MPLYAAFVMLFLSSVSAFQELLLSAPDPRVVRRLEWAKSDLSRGLACTNAPTCNDVALNTLALTALGRFETVRPALTAATQRTPLWLIAAHQYWLASDDDVFLREQWPTMQHLLFVGQSDRTLHDAGVLLAALDGLIAMARAMNDSTALERARAVYTLAEQRAQEAPGLIAPAFGLLEAERSDAHITRLADTVHTRWPLATGLIAVGLYEYHHDSIAFALVQEMATRETSTASMFVLALLRGMLGWEVDAGHRAFALEPHLPAGWNALSVSNLTVGQEQVAVEISRGGGVYALRLTREKTGPPLSVQVSPAFVRGARVRSVKVNDEDVPLHVELTGDDMHVVVQSALRREINIEIEYTLPRRASPR